MSSSGLNNSAKKGKGRQKVNMMKIENETNRQVTFSKRRAGLFKKASELSTLCGAGIAVVVFSPGNKAYSFGHPNVETISSRFLNENGPSMSDADKLLEARHKANISQQALELNQLERQLYLEKKRARELKQAKKVDINKLDYNQLCHLEGAIRNFQQEFEAKVQNATNFQMTRSSIGPSFVAPFNSDHAQYGNRGTISCSKGKSVRGGSSAHVRYDPGVGSSNAQVENTQIADDSCATIPYSYNVNPKSLAKY